MQKVYRDTDELIRKLSVIKNKMEATRELTKFYAEARFEMKPGDFGKHYTDGPNDGGIDFWYWEDKNFFILQTKFSERPKETSKKEICDEIHKLRNTIIYDNPNKKAGDFVDALRNNLRDKDAVLEIIWLTTNYIKQSVRDEIQEELKEWDCNIAMDIDFVAIDKNSLESVIYDMEHGYIPHAGKKTLKLEKEQYMVNSETGVYSVVCTANVNDILKWFKTSDEIDKFLQKNVREFLGETSRINKAIIDSYLKGPEWFWYKHNGIVIFADSLSVDNENMQLVTRNPQVVNGGQTLKALLSAYVKNKRVDNPAKVLLRIYRLTYEDTKIYKRSYERSIDIISALNSQNKINPSDLRSTDTRQVRLEQLFKRIGGGYKYLRKRSKEAKSGRYSIPMRNLALRYYVCKKDAPHEGVRGNVEELFEEKNKYDEIFDEGAINKDLPSVSPNHIVIDYVTCWNIDQILQKVQKDELSKRDKEYFQYTKWFVLWDIYRKLIEWKQKKFNYSWQTWIDFIESPQFETAVFKYARYAFPICRKIIPREEEPGHFLRQKMR